MQRINKLSQNIACQIAAGEVIERPASVVKELLENSIDANADKLIIEIDNGGIGKIRITDNGHGIHPEDLLLAFTPHATSKLSTVQDLFAINSLGFRGEALASIASVANVTMVSRILENAQAYMITGQTGVLTTPTTTGGDVGTVIDIRDLFTNVPVRKKFLKSSKTELIHIDNNIKRCMLGNFAIRFHVLYQQKKSYLLPAALTMQQREQRISKVLAKSFLEHAVHLELAASDLQLTGWVAMPTLNRRQSDWQFFYLNGRFIRDRLIQHAIRQAFGERLDSNFQPSYVLYLTMPSALVDVNVHPTKHEVRFQDSRYVHDFIVSAITKVLTGERATRVILNRTDFQVAQPNIPLNNSYEFKSMSAAVDDAAPIKDVLGILHNKILVATSFHGMVLLDLQALFVHLLWYQLQTLVITEYKNLLVPQTLSFSTNYFNNLLAISEQLQQQGLPVDILGNNTLVVRQAHGLYQGVNFQELLTKVAMTVTPNIALPQLRLAIVSALAQQFQYNSERHDINAMLKKLAKLQWAHTNCLGKTIWREFSLQAITEMI